MIAPAARAVRVYLPCTGLGRVTRGFETVTRECARALQGQAGVHVTVFGGGRALKAEERRVPSLGRFSAAATALGAVLRRDPYFIEQTSFALAFLPALIAGDPDVVYFSDLNLGNACWHWRRLSGQRFRLLYYNGGPTTRPFTRCDLVQQVSPEHLQAAVERGESRRRQVLLPHGMAIPETFIPETDDERRRTRLALGIPAEGPVVLSVGNLESAHKRMDYVVRETAALPGPRPHLLLLGAENEHTPAVRALADALLGRDGCTMRTVERSLALSAYRAADAFVLASLHEGFGMAHLEALAAGLPCAAHDSPTTRYIYGPHARLADLRVPGALTPLLASALGERASSGGAAAHDRHAWARDHFSWDHLAGRYVELFRACADGRAPQFAGD